MAITPTILADGQLGSTVAALYTATGDTYLTTIILTNVSGASRTVHLYVKGTGSDRSIIPNNLAMDDGDCFTMQIRGSLNNGDAIRGYADTASGVDFVIWGGT